MESETDDDAVHLNQPSQRWTKVGGGTKDRVDLGPEGGNTDQKGGWIDETGYGVPILASDEVAKQIGGEALQPAVSPRQERKESAGGYHSGSHTPNFSTSRPSSRPSSVHGNFPYLSRFTSRGDERDEVHTPLEDVEEYEPLFPEEEEKHGQPLINAADRFKQRPDVMKRRFPSQDIWEDTPGSLQLHATVSTPEIPNPDESSEKQPPSKTFEPPEVESARKEEVDESEKRKLIPKEERLSKSIFHPQLRDDMPTRPNLQQRFPSRDVWEDTPDSLQLQTTVQSDQREDDISPESATAGKPSIPARPPRSKMGEGMQEPSVPLPPSIPSRPVRRQHQVPPKDAPVPDLPSETKSGSAGSPTEAKKGPMLPARPKPQVPTRPSKTSSHEASEDLSLSKSISSSSATNVDTSSGSAAPEPQISPPVSKPKPSIPNRPAGGKISSIKAGFLTDLNSRLQLGPKPVPKQEVEETKEEKESVPLSDTRKGRARGPVRRKPGVSPAASTTAAATETSTSQASIAKPWSVWSIGDNGEVTLSTAEEPLPPAPTATSDNEIAADLDRTVTTDDATTSPSQTQEMSTNLETQSSAKSEEPLQGAPTVTATEDPVVPELTHESEFAGGDSKVTAGTSGDTASAVSPVLGAKPDAAAPPEEKLSPEISSIDTTTVPDSTEVTPSHGTTEQDEAKE